MASLHIEHPITDFEVWRAAFDRFADARAAAGVRRHLVRRPAEDPNYVVIDLDFADVQSAQAFLSFLEQTVWASSANSPALAGSPRAQVLETDFESE